MQIWIMFWLMKQNAFTKGDNEKNANEYLNELRIGVKQIMLRESVLN